MRAMSWVLRSSSSRCLVLLGVPPPRPWKWTAPWGSRKLRWAGLAPLIPLTLVSLTHTNTQIYSPHTIKQINDNLITNNHKESNKRFQTHTTYVQISGGALSIHAIDFCFFVDNHFELFVVSHHADVRNTIWTLLNPGRWLVNTLFHLSSWAL